MMRVRGTALTCACGVVLALTAACVAAPGEPAGIVTTLAGPIEAGTGGMDVDADGNVYTADFGAHLNQGPPGTRVVRITPTGDTSTFATGLVGASGNAFAANGDLFQANISAGTISRIRPDGTVEAFATEGFRFPVGIALDDEGALLVANCGANRITRTDASGVTVEVVADSLLQCPNGIARTPDGTLFVSNFANGDVVRIGPDGQVSRFATLPGDNNGHLLFGNGVLYVAARTANQIYELTLGGELRLLAGTGERGLGDGPAELATLSLPNDLGLSPDGSVLYWNDIAPDNPDPQVLTPTFVRALRLR